MCEELTIKFSVFSGIGGFLPRHRARGGGMVRSRLGSNFSKPLAPGDGSQLQQLGGATGMEVCREGRDLFLLTGACLKTESLYSYLFITKHEFSVSDRQHRVPSG